MHEEAGIWRWIPSVRTAERGRLAFFVAITALVSMSQTIGLVGAETLFLARYGVAELPQVFILASAVTIVGMLLYAALVGSTRNDKIFIHMLWMAGVGLAATTFGLFQGADVLLPGVFAGYFLTQAVFLNHFWTFATDYFDVLASKRLSHLFTFGASAGGALGGALALGMSQIAPAETLIGGWALGLLATALVVRAGRRGLMRWGLIELIEQDETSLEGMGSALRYVRRSALGHWLVGSAAAMTVALFVSQYLYSEIFVAAFPEEASLAFFLGAFLLVSNLGEIVIEFGLNPWLVKRAGVARANLIHPVTTVLVYVLLALDPRLYAGILARVNREVLENALSSTVRHLTYNAISQRLRGRLRALIEGIVVQSMMALAGLVLLLQVDPRWLCGAGGAMAIVYVFTNLRIRDEYLRTLVGGIREGRIDVSHLEEHLENWEASRLADLWDSLTEQGGQQVAANALQLAPMLAARGLAGPLIRGAVHPDPRVRCACLDALASTPRGVPEDAMVAALGDRDASVRRAAVRIVSGEDADPTSGDETIGRERPAAGAPAAGRSPRLGGAGARRSFDQQLHELLSDDDSEVRAETASVMGAPGVGVLQRMARSEDPGDAVAGLRRLPAQLAGVALERAQDDDADVRAAALETISRLASHVSIGSDRLTAELDHPSPRVRAAAVSALAATAAASAESLESAASGLADPSREVRLRTVDVLCAHGDEARRSAIPYLRSSGQGCAEAAIEVLSNSLTQELRKLFVTELRRRVRQAWGDLLALQALPELQSLSSRFLRAAHEDSVRCNQAVAFALLRGLEDPLVVASVERALRLGSPRTRSDALEVLSNLGDRRSAHLLVLMLEDGSLADKTRKLGASAGVPDDLDQAVDADRRAFDIWIQMGNDYFRKDGGGDISQRDTMERLLLLREIPLFARLSLDQLEAINRSMTESHYLRGEVVVREGDPAGELYLLIDGRVNAVSEHSTPDEVILNTLESPAYFGEMAILDDQPRSATIVVSADARLLNLSGEAFKDLMLQMPEISFEICRGLSTRVRVLESGPVAPTA